MDSLGYDIFNREKAKEDLRQWKKQLENWDDSEALERVFDKDHSLPVNG